MKTNLESENRSRLRENAKNTKQQGLLLNVAARSDFSPLKSLLRSALCALCVLLWQSTLASVHYVDVNSTNATPPYTNWTTAARIIQDAVDAAGAGDEIVVTNGIYASGGRVVGGDSTPNRMTVNKPLSVHSLNGPQFTVIDGGGLNRCVFLINGASLSGFTLTNGFAFDTSTGSYGGGGANGGLLTNCTLSGNSARGNFYANGGGAYNCTLNNCTLSSNSVGGGTWDAALGGGAYNCTLNNCILSGNSALGPSGMLGGGAYNCRLTNCTLSGNSASRGGGAYGGTLNNCTLTNNSGSGADTCTLNNCTLTNNSGGGASGCTLNNCLLSGNSGGGANVCTLDNCVLSGNSSSSGGGASSCYLNNCRLTGNSASYDGGGAYGCTMNNCTLTRNSAVNSGGGTYGGTLNNCLVYFNGARQAANYDSSTRLNYCCTTPQPPNGVANISVDPQLANVWRISAGSPCRGAGSVAYVSGTDIDGEAWSSPPSIGCDEYHAGALTGPLSVSIASSFTNVATGFTLQFTGLSEGRASANSWDFGDGIIVSNQPYTSHAWASPGDYAVVFRVFNETQLAGISATVTVHVVNAVLYVAMDSGNPVAPYRSWSTAARNLQDAVDAATAPGAQVVVSNGSYAPIQYRTYGLIVRSINGPQFTVINGGRSNSCAALTGGASLAGFTLTNGFSQSGGGASGGTLTNCVLTGNLASGPNFSGCGGGAYYCTLNNCTLSSNSSSGLYGGGVYSCILNDCTLTGNSGYAGGGAAYSTLNDCTLSCNSASDGGGAFSCTLNNSALSGNSASFGGGAEGCALNRCALTGNSATNFGGGAYGGTLNKCALTGNFGDGAVQSLLGNCALTGNSGFGARNCILTNCTVSGNSAGGAAGCGWYPGCTLNNCILYFNGGPNYDSSSTLNYCCTTPQPTNGVGNLSSDPQLVSAWRLGPGSPCRGAGSTAYTSGNDIDGEPWLNPPSIGCDEYHAGALTGSLSAGIKASFTNVLIGFTVQLTALVEGRITASSWDFGDGITVSNQPYTSHAWAALGDYAVVLRAYNESQPGGISATVIVHVRNGVHYVAANSPHPVAPYASWDTAATNIQQAINAVEPGGAVAVVVTNGNYAPVVASGPLTLRSVNGPLLTTIDGGLSNRCVLLTNGASLSGFTLTNGFATGCGGGLYCDSTNAVASNCVVSGNSASSSGGGVCGGILNNCMLRGNRAPSGGGAYSCTLNNSALSGNSASYYGGGGFYSTLNNCTLTVNSAGSDGGGAYGCTLKNCIDYFNMAPQGSNYDSSTFLNYCCTTPLPNNGVSNIFSDPQLASASHLSAGSPCRGAGNAAYTTGTDFDGEAWANPASIGCDEYYAGAVTGPLSVGIAASFTNALMGFTVQFTALIEGRTTANSWDFGDGTAATNQPYASHAWIALGDYAVVLRAYNETQPGGISATVIVHVGDGTHYVAANNANPIAPYASWATAATNIQDAVNVLEAGGPVALMVTDGNYTSVAVSTPLSVRSVNGPLFTFINGGQSNLCVSLTNGASLSGFALTNGQGGASGGTLDNCALTGNTLYGANYSTLSNCFLNGNAGYGATYSTLHNCVVAGNTYAGAYGCRLDNCVVSGNSGTGASSSSLTNCTLTGNSGGGVSGCTVKNSIIYFNSVGQAANYDSSSTLNYCCATPLATNGVGNLGSDPQLASASHLSAASPCRGAGNAAYASGTDIDGEAWANPPSIGCDEYYAGAATGALRVAITASYTNVLMGFAVQFTGVIQGRAATSFWDFGDGSTATNKPYTPYTSHTWAALGDYAVVLRAYNEAHPGGISATVIVHVVTGIHYVAADSTNSVAPYTSWATAATSLQDAINAAEPGAAQVVVSNGVYVPIYVPALMTVRSVNGPQFTTISGGGQSRCASLGTNAILSGFSLINGHASDYGGGAYGGTLNNCTLTGNVAEAPLYYGYFCIRDRFGFCQQLYHAYYVGNAYGGGAAYCTLNNCTLTGNTVEAPLYYYYYYDEYSVGNARGGGAAFCTLNNCKLTANQAQIQLRDFYYDFLRNEGGYGTEAGGGGVYDCTLTNCALNNNRVQGIDFYSDYGLDYVYVHVPGLGGGALDSTLNNCTLAGNSASDEGSGAYGSRLANCALTGNSGEGAVDCALTNCTLTGNSGVGASSSTLNNCIVYFNAAANYSSCSLNYCCTTPQPANGVGNISSDPQLASASHLSFLSPCLGKGSHGAASGVDIDGEPWANPPAIGCDELHAGVTTGPLTVRITASLSNVAMGYPVALTGLIGGRADLSLWSFGDGTVEINQPYVTHSWSATGDYAVTLWGFNDSYPDGISATQIVHVVTGVHYVAANSTSPVAPYTSWATAATNIQDAINTVEPGGSVVASNGIYAPIQASGTLTVRSVNGAAFTIINGARSNLCASLANSVSVSGFTLTNGARGAVGGTLNNCVLAGNGGSGASGCTLNNCALTGNAGTGALSSTLNNCTLSGNAGGGAYGCTLNNCVVYFNTAPLDPNYSYSTLNYCCTTPLPASGVGNISSDPRLASASRLSASSPCRGAGNATYTNGGDIDGEAWASPPSIGCDEYHTGAVTGPLGVGIAASFTNVSVGFPVDFRALIEGRTTASSWDFGDGNSVTNQPYTSHAWTAAGDYAVVLRAYNESQPGGISATTTVNVVAGVHYVAANSATPLAPYTSWATAATNIQDAVDAAIEPGAHVLVTNGIYATGRRAVNGTTNRVVTHTFLTLRSVNGPQFTTIDGGQSVRCVYLTNGATLSGFTLTHGLVASGFPSPYGAGVFCESPAAVVSNCVLAGNSASGQSGQGGGAYSGTLNNCTLTANSAYYGGGAFYSTLNDCTLSGNVTTMSGYGFGGGVYGGTLNNCTLTGNSSNQGGGAIHSTLNNCMLTGNWAPGVFASGGGAGSCTLNNCTLRGNSSRYGGGASGCTLNNCTLSVNSALTYYDSSGNPYNGGGGGASGCTLNNCIAYDNTGDNYSYSTLNFCCTTPQPAGGIGNITSVPLFDSNLRLQSNSPCINVGSDSYVASATDLDSNPRIAGGRVDIGAYEFQGNGLSGFTAWLWQYGLPTDGSANFTDSDGDVMNNWQEWVAGTDPTDAASALRLLTPVFTSPGVLLRWSSDTNHAYFVERASSLAPPITFDLLRTNVPGLSDMTTYIDTTAPSADGAFYRVGTDSTDSSAPLWLQTPLFVPAGLAVTWTSVTNRTYFLQRSSDLGAQQAFSTVQSNIVGQPGTTIYIDTTAIGAGPFFYRVAVSP